MHAQTQTQILYLLTRYFLYFLLGFHFPLKRQPEPEPNYIITTWFISLKTKNKQKY